MCFALLVRIIHFHADWGPFIIGNLTVAQQSTALCQLGTIAVHHFYFLRSNSRKWLTLESWMTADNNAVPGAVHYKVQNGPEAILFSSGCHWSILSIHCHYRLLRILIVVARAINHPAWGQQLASVAFFSITVGSEGDEVIPDGQSKLECNCLFYCPLLAWHLLFGSLLKLHEKVKRNKMQRGRRGKVIRHRKEGHCCPPVCHLFSVFRQSSEWWMVI